MVRGLSSYTEQQTLRREFCIFGIIVGMRMEDRPRRLTPATSTDDTENLDAPILETRRSRYFPPSSDPGFTYFGTPRRQRTSRTAIIKYARAEEADTACTRMNGARFDGEFIDVFRLEVDREPLSGGIPNGYGLHSNLAY
ncbi:hypothetical protein BDW74DRAFT_142268 [Aspergillus multicolor]|uniref:RNA recognition motif domain-containing protein n=1 Tax=Aspergillus multicolor TaxID=41759 RepID=UPI003CCCEDFE